MSTQESLPLFQIIQPVGYCEYAAAHAIKVSMAFVQRMGSRLPERAAAYSRNGRSCDQAGAQGRADKDGARGVT